MRISDWSSDVCSSDLRFFHRIFPAWHIAIEQINVMPWCAGELDHLCSLRPNDKAICLILGYQESLAGLNFTVAHNQGSALAIIYTVVRMTMQRRSHAGAPLNHRSEIGRASCRESARRYA